MSRKIKNIIFIEPIEVGGKEVKEVSMRPPKGKDLKLIQHIKTQWERDNALINNLCDLQANDDDFDNMEAAEYQQLMQGLIGFLKPTLKI